MITKFLTRIALVAGCAVGLAAPMAQAQPGTQVQTTAPRMHVGGQNDRFLDLSPAVQRRMRTECEPITNAHLRAGCIDSLAIDEDRRSTGRRDG
jgi:hypothetical protein